MRPGATPIGKARAAPRQVVEMTGDHQQLTLGQACPGRERGQERRILEWPSPEVRVDKTYLSGALARSLRQRPLQRRGECTSPIDEGSTCRALLGGCHGISCGTSIMHMQPAIGQPFAEQAPRGGTGMADGSIDEP